MFNVKIISKSPSFIDCSSLFSSPNILVDNIYFSIDSSKYPFFNKICRTLYEDYSFNNIRFYPDNISIYLNDFFMADFYMFIKKNTNIYFIGFLKEFHNELKFLLKKYPFATKIVINF